MLRYRSSIRFNFSTHRCRIQQQQEQSTTINALVSFRFCSSKTSESDNIKANNYQKQMIQEFWKPVNDAAQKCYVEGDEHFAIKEHALKYRMKDHAMKLSFQQQNTMTPSSAFPVFTWYGFKTNDPQFVEDFLLFLCTGFDIQNIDCTRQVFILNHSRSFLGWKPKPLQLTPEQLHDTNTTNNNPNRIEIPFSMEFVPPTNLLDIQQTQKQQQVRQEEEEKEQEENKNNDNDSNNENNHNNTKFSRVNFHCDLVSSFTTSSTTSNSTTPPNEVLDCVTNIEAVRMVVALRKAGVRPDVISWRALKSATKKTSTWASALGVM